MEVQERLPAGVEAAGGNARFAYEEFFAGLSENQNTERAYRRAVNRFLEHLQGNCSVYPTRARPGEEAPAFEGRQPNSAAAEVADDRSDRCARGMYAGLGLGVFLPALGGQFGGVCRGSGCCDSQQDVAAVLDRVDVELVRVATHPASRVEELLPANWTARFAPQAPELALA